MAVNDKIDLTFAAGLRSFLRHDPDVIMVGEIRDRDTAEIAIQASLTGHLVLSTIHTNDAAGAITRLVDLGVQPFLVASSLMALLAQRLVRRVCLECREAYQPRRRGPGQHRHRPGGVRARPGAAGELQGRRGVRAAARDAVPRARGRLPGLPGRRLQGPDGDLRAADHRREDPPADHQERRRRSRSRATPSSRACARCARTAPRRCWRA